MRRAASLLLAVFLTLGGSPYAYGQDPPPQVFEAGISAAGQKPESKETDEATNTPQDQEETGKAEPEPETKKSEAPAESGDDIGSQLEEAAAQEAPEPEDEKPSPEEKTSPIQNVVKEEEQDSGENVGGSLEESRDYKVGLFEHGPLEEMYRYWRPVRDGLLRVTGINVGMAYTTLVQAAMNGERRRQGWSGDFDFFGKWVILNRDEPNTGSAGFLAESRHRIARITPNALNDSLGALWRSTKGFNSQEFALVQLWWEQYLFDDHVKVVAGKIDASNYYNGNRFQSQNTSFLNQAFSGNPTRAFPNNGLGVNVRMAPSDDLYCSFGVHDTNNSKTTTGFENLDEDELFYAVEVGLTPRFERWGQGRYRFTGWHAGPGKRTRGESGSGFALSFEQDLGNDLVPFFRYGYQGDKLRATRQVAAAGVGVLNPLGRKKSANRDDDVLGIFEFRVRVVF